MDLEFRHLKIVVAVAEHGSITRAASVLGLSQPALTSQVQRIERAIGGVLFERTKAGTVPTPFGRSVIARARTLLAEMSDLRGSGPADDGPVTLRMGAMEDMVLPGMIPRLVELDTDRRSPTEPLRVRVHSGGTRGALIGQIRSGQIDAAIVLAPSRSPWTVDPEVVYTVLIPVEPTFVALSEKHPLAGATTVGLADLAGEQWTTDPNDDIAGAGALRAACRLAGFEPVITYELADSISVRGLVGAGQCVSLMSANAVEGMGIVVRPIEGDPLGVRIELATRPTCPVDPELVRTAFVENYLLTVNANPSFSRWWAANGRTDVTP